MHDTHDRHHGHHGHHGEHGEHPHRHESAKSIDEIPEATKLRKMVEHWISHNEDHASSYRQWADRARNAGFPEPGAILEQIASDVIDQNKKLVAIIQIIDSPK